MPRLHTSTHFHQGTFILSITCHLIDIFDCSNSRLSLSRLNPPGFFQSPHFWESSHFKIYSCFRLYCCAMQQQKQSPSESPLSLVALVLRYTPCYLPPEACEVLSLARQSNHTSGAVQMVTKTPSIARRSLLQPNVASESSFQSPSPRMLIACVRKLSKVTSKGQISVSVL